jgi:DNA-binding MarR family transcriptional regulator
MPSTHLSRTPTPEVKDVLDLLRQIFRSQRVASRAAEKQVGLSAAQLLVLQRLSAGASPSLNELAEQTQTHQSSTSVVVSKLVSRGFVERQRAKGDARRLELKLTSRAKTLVRKTPHAAQDQLIAGLETMSKAEVKQLAMLLKKFIASAGLDTHEGE